MTDYGMKDSGARQEFETGARRDLQTGKGRPDLIPTLFIQRLAVVMEKGAEKYGDRNWEKGMPLSRYYASAQRHLMQAFDGDTDEDHLGQCAFNVAAFMWTLNEIDTGRMPEHLDDRPFARDESGPLSTAGWIGQGTREDPIRPKRSPAEMDAAAYADDDEPLPEPDPYTGGFEAAPSPDDAYTATPAGQQLLENLAGLDSLEAANQKLRDAGLVECFDGVWRPASMPVGTRIQTPICEQKGEVIEPRPAVFEPRRGDDVT